MHPAPTSAGFRAEHHHIQQEDLQNRQDRLKNPLQGAYPKEKDGELPTEPILNFSQGNKIHWFLGPYSTEASKAGRSETHARRENQGPTQP